MDLLDSPGFPTHVSELQDKWHVPGVAIAVVQGNTFASKGFGKASLDPAKPCTPDSLFDIASSSKSLTAASVALLVADSVNHPNVQWDATMSSLLPDDFVMSGEGYTDNVTVEDVLSHRTGLPSHDDSYLGVRAAHPDTAQSVTRNVRNLPVSAPLRSKFMYNNLMYTVATYLVETMSGHSFTDFLRTHFFQPLGMTSTHLQPDSTRAAGLGDRIVTPYAWSADSSTYAPVELQQSPEDQGAGSIITSANDYIKWVKAMMNQEPPITTEVYKGLTKPRMFYDPDNDDLDPFTSFTAYCVGLETRYYRGYMIVQHDGAISGFGSSHFFLPQQKFGGVVFGNSCTAPELTCIIAQELIDEALEVPEAERPDWDARYEHKTAEEDEKDDVQRLKKRLCPDFDGIPQPQKIPLSSYTGEYWNAGYHGMVIETKNDRLFIDASARSTGFYATFEHICGQTHYIAHVEYYFEGGHDPLIAEFKFENDKVVKMGLKLEHDMDGLVWFDKVDKPV